MNINKWTKRGGLGLVTAALVIAGAASLAAFEAHVVNVTARIENALFVHPESLEFGTVFPQEHLETSFFITFSNSFSTALQKRVGRVDYVIKQKPKPRVDTPEERLWCHDNWPPANIGDPADPYYVRCYPFLGPFLSKHPDNLPATGPNGNNDVGVPAFHNPFDPSSYALGKLVKFNPNGTTTNNDPGDFWTIDLAVPCFEGF